MKYNVEITEVLQRTVQIDAGSERLALVAAKKLYYGEKIVLDSNHHVDTGFDVLGLDSKIRTENNVASS